MSEHKQNAHNDGNRAQPLKQLFETLFLAIKKCTGFTTDVIQWNTKCAVSLANQLRAVVMSPLRTKRVFYYKVSGEYLREDSQSVYSFCQIQNVGETELSEEKIQCFIGHSRKISYFLFHICIHIYIYIYNIYIYIHYNIYII